MRAREPERSGYAVRAGVRLYYEVFGSGPSTVVLLPAWAIVHSGIWKLQVPYLARHFRVITFDPRGNGHSDRPTDPADYANSEQIADALAILDATGTERAVCVGQSSGGHVLLRLAAVHPHRIAGAVFVAPSLEMAVRPARARSRTQFDRPCVTDVGWGRYNAEYWRRDLRGFAEFFFGQAFPEPHASKQIDDAVGWALETDAQTLIAIEHALLSRDMPDVADMADMADPADPADRPHPADPPHPAALRLAAQVRCPSLVIHGDEDRIVGLDTSVALARALECPIEILAGGGHCLPARHPVWFNLLVRRFAERVS